MRLRYLHIRGRRPLEDVAITFGHERILGRDCAIHFVVGVNGSGKSRLLRALAEVFLRLERQQFPPFEVSLAYDLGTGDSTRTIYLFYNGRSRSRAALVEFKKCLPDDTDWKELETVNWDAASQPGQDSLPEHLREQYDNHFMGNALPGTGTIRGYLPSVLLAYTSGDISEWETIFKPDRVDWQEQLATALESLGPEDARPLNWSPAKETEYMQREGASGESEPQTEQDTDDAAPTSLPGIGVFISPERLKLALCAVTLHQAVQEFREMPTEAEQRAFLQHIEQSFIDEKRMPGLRGILNTIGWLWPVTIGLRLTPHSDLHRQDENLLEKLGNIASSRRSEPDPGTAYELFFDLRRPLPDQDDPDTSTGASLLELLGGETATPFSVFKQLTEWQRDGILDTVSIALRKYNLDKLILYDWLSDGERVFLGRMALFHLLTEDEQGKDDALVLLDEPETHFNDIWKREIVDTIDSSLWSSASEVVIATHSSIALSDVFDTEITLLEKSSIDGTVEVVPTPIKSFGASPADIMRDIFGASDSVGQRATEFLDLVLAVAAHPDEVEYVWSSDDQADIQNTAEFQRLQQVIQELPHNYGDDRQSAVRLLNALQAVKRHSTNGTINDPVTVIDALSAIQDRLGPGYYQFEFRRRLRGLRERNSNATSD
jgi:energy-coupling factor transporter ATP-binding protein EcfA2